MIFTSFLFLILLINVDALPTDPHLERSSDIYHQISARYDSPPHRVPTPPTTTNTGPPVHDMTIGYVYLPNRTVSRMMESEINSLPVIVEHDRSSLLEGTTILDTAYRDPVAAMRTQFPLTWLTVNSLYPGDFEDGYYELNVLLKCAISANRDSFIKHNRHQMVFVDDQHVVDYVEYNLPGYLRRFKIEDPDPIWFARENHEGTEYISMRLPPDIVPQLGAFCYPVECAMGWIRPIIRWKRWVNQAHIRGWPRSLEGRGPEEADQQVCPVGNVPAPTDPKHTLAAVNKQKIV
ncbi:hypothetical protein BDP27DRAFT_1377771 [Rhodocollybia butyracea]|uniref:Uncharacterized protein n=1 Tax=Rhodocollybia butyracea TaxID=206335 RepID=A0A9P5P5Y8_9AGAR|nr:hypothetical protein BDP27DRAFT_1377771 [Rhodocollybia butyracea]